jgi:hypothetical protein
MDKEYEELKQAFKVTVDLYDNVKFERDKLELENIKLEIANRKLTNALGSLVDGLDANYSETFGLTDDQWEERIKAARLILGGD